MHFNKNLSIDGRTKTFPFKHNEKHAYILMDNFPKIEKRQSTPSIMEWKDNTYSFDKRLTSSAMVRNNALFTMLNSYFNISYHNVLYGVKRFRELRKKKSTFRFFVGEPEIKHSPDKKIITIHLFGLKKDILEARIFKLLKSCYRKVNLTFKSKYFLGVNRKTCSKDFLDMLTSYTTYNRELFKYLLFRYLLLSIGINISVHSINNRLNGKSKVVLTVDTPKSVRKSLGSFSGGNEHLFKYSSALNASVEKPSDEISLYIHLPFYKDLKSGIRKSVFLKKVIHIQHFLLQAHFINHLYRIENKNLIYKKIKFLLYLLQYNSLKFRKKSSILFRAISIMEKMYSNINKLSIYLPFLKSSLKKLYGTNIDLIIKLTKYPHLNSSIFTQILGVKLKDRRRGVFNLITRSINLIALPRFIKYNYTTNYSSLPNINNYFAAINYDELGNEKVKVPATNALIGLKSKWITGIFLEAKGRLTQRYSIARSKRHVVNRGNIQNTESSLLLRPSILLRNSNESNIQYTSLQDKRRIGVFGLKVWISSN